MSDIVLPEQGVTENEGAAPHGAALWRDAPRVGAAAAALSRRLGRGLRIALEAPAGHPAELTVRLAAPEAALPPAPALYLAGAAGPLRLDDGARLLRALTGLDLTAMADADGRYPDWFVAAVAGRLAGTPFDGVAGIGAEGAIGGHGACTLHLTLRQHSHAITVAAHAAPATWLAMLDGVAATRLRARLADFPGLVVAAPVRLGRHRLPASACRALAAGDIIVPASPCFDVGGNGVMHLAGAAWRVRYLAPGNLQLITLENIVDMDQSDAGLDAGAAPAQHEDTQADGAQDGAELDQVPLTLVFELGRIGLPLAELRTLAPHAILTLDDGGPRAIAIVCGGRTVGRGEVVDVDGALGIRVIQWGGAC